MHSGIVSVSHLVGLGLPVAFGAVQDGAQAAGGGSRRSSWEGVDDDPDETVNSEFLFGAFNLR